MDITSGNNVVIDLPKKLKELIKFRWNYSDRTNCCNDNRRIWWCVIDKSLTSS